MHTSLITAAAGSEENAGQQVTEITERIASAISIGMLTVGERLPAEIELANQFGVAVATLRKSLAALRSQGIVETRRGRNGGTFIIKAPFPSAEALREALLRTSVVELRDLADEHAAVSSATARLAAERTPPDRPTRLAELAFRAREARGTQQRTLADSRFHIEIAVLSQSKRLLTAEQRLQSEIAPLIWCEGLTRNSTQESFNDHLALVMAIEQHRPDEAHHVAKTHVLNGIRHIIDARLKLSLAQLPHTGSSRSERASGGIES